MWWWYVFGFIYGVFQLLIIIRIAHVRIQMLSGSADVVDVVVTHGRVVAALMIVVVNRVQFGVAKRCIDRWYWLVCVES